MTDAADALPRLAAAAERIAEALEYLVRASASAGPQPRLTVARAPTATSRLAAVNLTADGKIFATVQNTGEAHHARGADRRARSGARRRGIIDRDSREE